ncbi:hypothetical protein JFT37_14320 [Pseudomonas fluorescens]|nr:hypothetical protein [Pseudomonas fluorescens]
MDTLTKAEIETALSARLPKCALNADGSLSVTVTAHGMDQFTIANINRAHYHGVSGINRLVREIREEMVIARQSFWLSSVG